MAVPIHCTSTRTEFERGSSRIREHKKKVTLTVQVTPPALGTINLIRVSSPANVECNDRLLLVASFVKSVNLNVHCFADWKWFVWNVSKNCYTIY